MAKKPMLLSREDILRADDLPRELVDVEEWGGAVYVRGLTAAERDKFEASLFETKGKGPNARQVFKGEDVRAKLAALTMVDAEGNRIFNDGDVKALAKKSAQALSRVYDVASRLSGMTKEDQEELEGNSDETTDGDLSSD